VKTSDNGAPILSGNGLKTVRERIAQEFERARTVERRRYAHPGELDPAQFGRRKDDPPPKPAKSRPALSLLAKPILEDAVKAAPLIYHRRPDVVVHDLGDVSVVDDVPKLFDAALRALGYSPENPPDEPRKKQSIGVKGR
jgi:hypothetical protein